MRLTTLISSFFLAAVALAAAVPVPQPQGRALTNAQALARGLPLKKPRVCDAACKANRLARRSKPSHTSLPARSVQFRKTCADVTYNFAGSGAIMTGTCADSFGNVFTTSLDLNNCITPNKGTLMCMPSGFTTTGGCTACSVDGETLNCMCPNSKGVLTKASLNLNACIGNKEGQLYCNKHED
ncbi:Cyanovirin-N [Cutaneotrichosporon oleaginosum]|uniref:Cyanovirin-N n=1 Tax=Cutaneotrichosporon oleaginosum TaxID=879819 RepID=A0A0J0XE61_9TREE|nr:Cyanovirin-N [Cutaneotrichosporon oleaginosum]KLT39303.1 Cyanovirin-N [Cutaneotrichosporon oleaginosum]TXT08560.1 hypothetical protein COLE_05484 [Cutaneotrichosporon oleaginosum]